MVPLCETNNGRTYKELMPLLMKTPKYVTDPMIIIQMTSFFMLSVSDPSFLRYFFVLYLPVICLLLM